MSKNTLFKLALLSSTLVITGASCAPVSRQAGIFFSPDLGSTWEQRVTSASEEFSLASDSISDIELHPVNSGVLYAATRNRGVVYSDNAGNSWQQITNAGSISSLDIHPRNSELLIASKDNEIYLTKDGGDVWSLVFTNQDSVSITDTAFAPQNLETVYASSNSGDVFISSDSARSWRLLSTFDSAVTSIEVHPGRPNTIFAVVRNEGVFRSQDNGVSWEDITESLKKPLDAINRTFLFHDLVIHYQDPSDLMLLTSRGIYKSSNSGNAWESVSLLDEEQAAFVSAIGWDPQNQQRMYYFANNVFHRSVNAGRSWETIPLQLSSTPTQLEIDPFTSQAIYLGTETN